MFFSNKDLKAKITSLEEENKELKAQAGSVESLQSDNDDLSEKLAAANNALEVANAKNLDVDKVVTEAAEAKAKAEKVIADQPAAVAAKAASTVSALGVDPVAEVAGDSSVEGVEALGPDAQYKALAKQLESCSSPSERGVIAQKMLKIIEKK